MQLVIHLGTWWSILMWNNLTGLHPTIDVKPKVHTLVSSQKL